jgi:hypothetical protein
MPSQLLYNELIAKPSHQTTPPVMALRLPIVVQVPATYYIKLVLYKIEMGFVFFFLF